MAPTEGAYGFVGFRRQANADHYALEVEPDRRHVSPGTVRGEQRFDHAYRAHSRGSDPSRRGHEPPRAVGAGREIVVLINDEQVGRARDDRWADGGITLGVGHRADGAADGRFANLVVMSAE